VQLRLSAPGYPAASERRRFVAVPEQQTRDVPWLSSQLTHA
jgi:hypothetical protein